MGFDIINDPNGFLEAVLIIIAVAVSIPVLIWFVVLVRQARADVVEDSDTDLEA